jgi:hypothetical protein
MTTTCLVPGAADPVVFAMLILAGIAGALIVAGCVWLDRRKRVQL